MKTTRYQAVWSTDAQGVRTYTLCEVELDPAGRLVGWSDGALLAPQGEAQARLIDDLSYMFADAVRWKAVAYHSLRPGMRFDQRD
jgi:hypothetical protein